MSGLTINAQYIVIILAVCSLLLVLSALRWKAGEEVNRLDRAGQTILSVKAEKRIVRYKRSMNYVLDFFVVVSVVYVLLKFLE